LATKLIYALLEVRAGTIHVVVIRRKLANFDRRYAEHGKASTPRLTTGSEPLESQALDFPPNQGEPNSAPPYLTGNSV
jgi:hypothetical protein